MSDLPPLDPRLERMMLREVSASWRLANRDLFRAQLVQPVFAMSDERARLATWHPRERQMTFSRHLVLGHPWRAVVEVLHHEMAHQYVSEVLRVTDEAPHGAAFQRVCAERDIDATAHGLPAGSSQPDPTEDRVIRRVKKLLALGGSTNEHEARAATRAAQRLMLEHNLAWLSAPHNAAYGARQLGRGRLRVPSHEKILCGILTRHFFVRGIWLQTYLPERGKWGRAFEISGTPANVELATYVHAYVRRAAEQAWASWRDANPRHASGERQRYLLGVMLGFRESLDTQQQANAQHGLVWVGDPGLEAFIDKRYPHRRAGRKITYMPTRAVDAGKAEGRQLKIHRGLGTDASARGRLLGG